MKARSFTVPAVVIAIGLVTGCSELNDDRPDIVMQKCEVCHTIPPRDSAKVTGKDTNMVGIHFIHVTQQGYTCDICHNGYDKKTGTWEVAANHYSDTARGYDSSRCARCHDYLDCNNPECHNTPPTGPKPLKTVHDLHARPLDPTSADTVGKYHCTVCHKGYDVENMVTPLDLPLTHNDGVKDVVFDLPFPTDSLSPPFYVESLGTCNYVYCHGTTIPGGKKKVSMGDKVDTVGNAECNACHDTLVLASQVLEHSREDHASNFSDCLNCHDGYLLKGGITNPKHHINGKIDLEFCTNCHDTIPLPFIMTADSVITKLK